MREREVDNVSKSGRMKTPSTDMGKHCKKIGFVRERRDQVSVLDMAR